MKKFHVWAIADIGIIIFSIAVGIMAFTYSAKIVPMLIGIVIGFATLITVDRLLSRWYYSRTSPREKIHNAEDDM